MQDRALQVPSEPEQPASCPAISSQEVEAELEKILASPLFSRAPRHSRFLEFVVRKKLAGLTECVKESLIGVEVFGRSPDYDPGSEPAVRVEAGRLRLRLTEYYRGPGRHDPIQLSLPKGTYVPVFSRNGIEPPLEEAPRETDCSSGVADSSSPAANGVEKLQSIPSQPSGGRESSAHPAVSHAGRLTVLKIGAAVAAIGIGAFILIRMLTADNRPASGRLDGSTLIISNAQGLELWRKSFTDGFWPEYYAQGLAPRIWFGDLEGTGRMDVLLLYHPAVNPTSHSTTLICYSDRGREKWRWTPGRAIPELEGDPAAFETVGFGVLNGAAAKRSRIVVSSKHLLWYPHQIALLDSNGKMLSEYWHSGNLNYLTLADLNGDGREEIIATGISNGYRQATLIVLDPDRLSGASYEPARPDLQIHGMGIAHERLRLLFPRSDLNRASALYNQAQEANVLDGRIALAVLECQQIPRCFIRYEFDPAFHLRSAVADDQFRGAHADFYFRSKPSHRFSDEEEAEFQKVRCLVGCGTEFVPVQIRSASLP